MNNEVISKINEEFGNKFALKHFKKCDYALIFKDKNENDNYGLASNCEGKLLITLCTNVLLAQITKLLVENNKNDKDILQDLKVLTHTLSKIDYYL